MRKYNIFVSFEAGEEFTKLVYSFESIPEAIEYASQFVKNVNNLRTAIGVNKRLTDESWHILSDDEKISIDYDSLYNGYQVIDFDKLEKILVTKNSKTALMSR